MSWRTVIVSSHAKRDLQVGFMQIRGEDGIKRVILDEFVRKGPFAGRGSASHR